MPLRRCAPLLIGAVVFGLYAITRTAAHSGDDIQWMLRVEQAVTGVVVPHPSSTRSPDDAWSTPGAAALQPRYYLALPSAALAVHGARALGWSGPSITPVQLLHALWGALGIVWFFLAMRRVVGPTWSALTALGLSTSYAWWYYGTHADYLMPAQALSALFLYALVRTLDDRNRFASDAALGAAAAVCLLFMQTRIVLIVVGAIALGTNAWLNQDHRRQRLRTGLSGYVVGIVATLIVGVLLGAVLTRVAAGYAVAVPTWQAASYPGDASHAVAFLDVPKVLYGFAKSLVVYPGLGDREPHDLLASSGLGGRLAFAAWYGTVTVAAVLPLLLIARQWPALQRDRRLLIVLLAWIALELPFLIYWEPSYVKYFGPVLIPWWASAAILLAHAFGAQPAVRRAFVAAALVFIAGVGTTNLVAGFAPAAYGGTDWRRIGALLASRSSRQDLFISAEYRPLDFYLPYFDQRRVVSAEFVSTAARNDPAQVEHTLRRLMRETAERGGRVFAYPCGDPPRLRIAALVDPSTERLESLPLDGSTPSGFAVCEIRATR